MVKVTSNMALAAKVEVNRARYNVPARVAEAMARGDAQFVLDSLTDKQRSFVEEYLVDLQAAAAVRRSDYECTDRNAARIGLQLKNHPVIRYCIDSLKAQRRESSDVTADFVLTKIVETIARCEQMDKPDNNAILRATEILARHLGMLRDRQEISGPDGGAIETRDTKDAADQFMNAIGRLAERANAEVE